MKFLEILKAIFLGIVEGITEWLPISSTGHMILVDEFLHLDVTDEFRSLFFVVIQIGAILAVPVLFFDKLNPFSKKKTDDEKKQIYSLWLKIAIGVIPAVVIGFFVDDLLDKYFYGFVTVAVALIVYGIAFIVFDHKNRVDFRVMSVYDLSYKDAFLIGCFQVLALIPGTSRSGSTVLGGMLTGVSRTASAEFSFFMAIPIMFGASFLKIVKFLIAGFSATIPELVLLMVGIAVSFFVSIAAIKFLMSFVRRHSFSAFGVYRIVLGALVLGYFFFAVL